MSHEHMSDIIRFDPRTSYVSAPFSTEEVLEGPRQDQGYPEHAPCEGYDPASKPRHHSLASGFAQRLVPPHRIPIPTRFQSMGFEQAAAQHDVIARTCHRSADEEDQGRERADPKRRSGRNDGKARHDEEKHSDDQRLEHQSIIAPPVCPSR